MVFKPESLLIDPIYSLYYGIICSQLVSKRKLPPLCLSSIITSFSFLFEFLVASIMSIKYLQVARRTNDRKTSKRLAKPTETTAGGKRSLRGYKFYSVFYGNQQGLTFIKMRKSVRPLLCLVLTDSPL